MNIKRSLGFALLVYVLSFIAYMAIQLGFNIEEFALREYIVFWIVLVPVVLLSAKWYFKMDAPTTKKGFMLGIYAIVVGILLDVIMAFAGGSAQETLSMMYQNWMFIASLGEVLLLTTFAGFEFDGTYTKES